jgi:hypothetical protein
MPVQSGHESHNYQAYFSCKGKQRRLVVEGPENYRSDSMREYIEQEIARPCKQWIHDVISSKREVERVKLKTTEFILLPDVDCMNKKGLKPNPCPKKSYWPNPNASNFEFVCYKKKISHYFHWLAVVADPSLRTLRDLRGHHVPLLKTIYNLSCEKLFQEFGVERDQVVAYIHYPPSVYQLHIHFKYPVKTQPAHDAFRTHPLLSVINNLEVDSDYYAKSFIQIPVYPHTEFYSALLYSGLSVQQRQWLSPSAETPRISTRATCHSKYQSTLGEPCETDTLSVTSDTLRSGSSSPGLSA